MLKRKITNREQAREYAIDWQKWAGEARTENMSYSELSEWQSEFYDLAIKFDLLEEFKENGII